MRSCTIRSLRENKHGARRSAAGVRRTEKDGAFCLVFLYPEMMQLIRDKYSRRTDFYASRSESMLFTFMSRVSPERSFSSSFCEI